MVNKKTPNPVDAHIGARVRMRRLMMGMSQEKLADALDLTFQQIQKYEKGVNRIGGSRMTQIAKVLEVPVAFLFEGAGEQSGGPVTVPDNPLSTLGTTNDGIDLARAFNAIGDVKARKHLVGIAEDLARIAG